MSADSFENNHVRAYWNKDLQCVVIDAKESAPREQMRAGVDSALELMRRHGATRVMADQTLLQMLASERATSRHDAPSRSTQRSDRHTGEMADYLHTFGR